MKLSAKLTLFLGGSKLLIALLFIFSLPFLVGKIASAYTNAQLRAQKAEVLKSIGKNGIVYYLQGETAYGSYTMLKEEYISLEETNRSTGQDTIKDSQRLVEQDTLNYRVLSFVFRHGGKNYLAEIGKTNKSIVAYNRPLQRFALYLFCGLILLSMLVDLAVIRRLLAPLGHIIRKRLGKAELPFQTGAPSETTGTSDFRFLEQAILKLQRQVNEAFLKEREFTANASHEFMTPISILQSKMENLLNDEALSESLQPRLAEMMQSLERLKKMCTSLLLISRIDNEQFSRTDSVAPALVLTEVLEDISHRIEQKEMTLVTAIDPARQITRMNKDLLFHLLYNLINNAVKFSHRHGTLHIYDELQRGKYLLHIADAGNGIPAEEQEQIFERFRKGSNNSQPGSGLGLALVKSIANSMDIGISVRSETGKGATFSLSFPV
ncbi:two-component sensor histidine kinase [Pedobacter yulinensis]|uniref:histidine kinase n=1 Tax=Pedobacter yulinensis TaxID=2126353 RepID=A0A2T3HKA0_9SPHI|nr:HAMP domain-containing sensor histidine kinase [Pedobacter yulinensis]PST82850.1 two-component sensor histidine kinase [Pedobacter yulinensis]